MRTTFRCSCKERHTADPRTAELIETIGTNILIAGLGDQMWWVPRIYIEWHGRPHLEDMAPYAYNYGWSPYRSRSSV